MAQKELIKTHTNVPRHFLSIVRACTYTHKCCTIHTPHLMLSGIHSLPPFIIQSALIQCQFLDSLPFPPQPKPLVSPLFFTLFHVLLLIPEWNLSSSLTLMNHSPHLKTPITSDGIASVPLIFTKLSIHCQDCIAGYNIAVTHLAELRVYKVKTGFQQPAVRVNTLQ